MSRPVGADAAPDRYVTFYCDDASHTGTPWVLATFVPQVGPDGAETWHLSVRQYLAGRFVRVAEPRDNPIVWLPRDDDDHADAGPGLKVGQDWPQRTTFVELPWVRTSVTFDCRRCGERVRRRGEHVLADLVKLESVGVQEVSISDYRRALR